MRRFITMFKLDFRRMFTQLLIYILIGGAFLLPILFLVMTTMMDGSVTIDPSTGEEKVMEGFTNAWQALASLPSDSTGMSMEFTSMCNMDMLFVAVLVLTSLFISADFRSGYAKNLFTVRPKKSDYVASKILVCFIASTLMFVAFFIGIIVGGKIAGLPFTTEGFGVSGIICSLLSKIFLSVMFVGIATVATCFAKEKTWISIVGSLALMMIFFTMISMLTPLNATIVNVLATLIGGGVIAFSLGACANLILKKRSIL